METEIAEETEDREAKSKLCMYPEETAIWLPIERVYASFLLPW